jgi:hypothetical protein
MAFLVSAARLIHEFKFEEHLWMMHWQGVSSMNKKLHDIPPQLRKAAEARMKVGLVTRIAEGDNPDLRRLVQELQVHQIELEMQNEALRQTEIALKESHDRYADLYEYAPVG